MEGVWAVVDILSWEGSWRGDMYWEISGGGRFERGEMEEGWCVGMTD